MRKLLAALLCLSATSTIAAVSVGSGFFITSDGYFVTNHHVIASATAVNIRDSQGKILRATIAADDATNDISILKVEGTFDALAIGNSRSGKPGTRVVTMGFPLVTIQGAETKITEGIIK
jgi:serine protease Do